MHAVGVETGSVRVSSTKLRTIRPAADQQHERQRHLGDHHGAPQKRPAPSAAVRPPARRTSITSGRDARIAGIRPKIRRSATPARPRTTGRGSMVTDVCSRGSFSGPRAGLDAGPREAAQQRAAAASRRLSASNCRTRRPRCRRARRAPRAHAPRAAARTSSRLATLAHAMSSTNVTAPISARISGTHVRTRSSCMRSRRKWQAGRFLDRESLAADPRRRRPPAAAPPASTCRLQATDVAARRCSRLPVTSSGAARSASPASARAARPGAQQFEARLEDADDLALPVADPNGAAHDVLRPPKRRCQNSSLRMTFGGTARRGGPARRWRRGSPSASMKSRPRIDTRPDHPEEVRR